MDAQRFVTLIAGIAVLAALGVGLWPVHASVFGDPSYSCGSGFFHSGATWHADSRVLSNERAASNLSSTGTPETVCPDKVYGRRDFALLLGASAVVLWLLVLVLLQRPREWARGPRLQTIVPRRAPRRPPAHAPRVPAGAATAPAAATPGPATAHATTPLPKPPDRGLTA